MTRFFFTGLMLVICNALLGQENIKITGKVTSNGNPVGDAVIEFSNNQKIIRVLSNDKGLYGITGIVHSKNDSINIVVTAISYKTMIILIDSLTKDTVLDFILLPDTTLMQEVIVKGSNVVSKASKKIYTINSNNFIPNAKADVALQSLPNLFVQEDGSALINNHLKAIYFIDGIEADEKEIKKLSVSDISKVEIISNPNASYGASFTGGVINIITKKKAENFIKGELETYVKARLNLWGVIPSVSYKSKHIILRIVQSYRKNNQETKNDLMRTENNGIFFNQNGSKNILGNQKYTTARIKIDLTKKSILNLGSSYFGYKFLGSADGVTMGNANNTVFHIDSKEKYGNFSIYSVYNYKITKTKVFFAKVKHYKYNNEGNSTYRELLSTTNTYNEVISNNDENSGEIVFQNTEAKFYKKKLSYSFGYKSILRNFNFDSSSFFLKQNVNNLYLDSETELNKKLSLSAGVAFDITTNKIPNYKQNYNYLLPTFSIQYQFKNNLDLRFDYAKKILRPNVDELNAKVYFINPSLSIKGNENLQPQLRNYFAVSLSKATKSNVNISLNIFDENIKNAIIATYTQQGNMLISSYENAASYNIAGGNVSINAKLFKLIRLNASTGITYHDYTSNTGNTLVKENKGVSFSNNLSLSTLIHKKLSLSINGFYDSKEYTLVSTTTYNPQISFSAERAFLKKKLNIRLTYNDMFGLYTKSTSETKTDNFNQIITNRNRITNFSINLIYSFGKIFNDRFTTHAISNDDIENK